MKKCKPIDHRFESDGGPCLKCGKTMLEIFSEHEEKRRLRAQKKAEKTRTKSITKNNDYHSSDALDGCSSISQWEERHGRGFWGSAANGYVYDKYNR